MYYREILEIETEKGVSVEDITDMVNQVVEKASLVEGICFVYCTATTAGLMVNENDAMLLGDFKRFFEESVSEERLYNHASNGFSHLRAAMLRTDLMFPIANNALVLGEWQSVFLWEFDTVPRKRQVVVTVEPSVHPEVFNLKKKIDEIKEEEEEETGPMEE